MTRSSARNTTKVDNSDKTQVATPQKRVNKRRHIAARKLFAVHDFAGCICMKCTPLASLSEDTSVVVRPVRNIKSMPKHVSKKIQYGAGSISRPEHPVMNNVVD